jgi:ribosomal protein S18 acetylase RimI-like enzyme
VAPPELRRAVAADVPLVARVLEMSGRGHLERGAWDVLFPDPVDRARALERIASGPRSWCRWDAFHVATVDGEPVAAMAAFEPTALGGTSLGPPLGDAFSALGWDGDRAGAALERASPYMLCFPAMPDGTWIVENVGTRPSHRRRGLVADLLDRVLAEGRSRGHARAQISCLIGNEPARFAYERAGFEVVEKRTHPDFEALLGAPGFFRMERPLSS